MVNRLTYLAFSSGTKETCGLYYKPITIVNDDPRVINKLETSLTGDTRVVIYDHHMFIVYAIQLNAILLSVNLHYIPLLSVIMLIVILLNVVAP
jgi:hypothetical protein